MHDDALYFESWGVGLASSPLTISEPITTISYNSWDNNYVSPGFEKN